MIHFAVVGGRPDAVDGLAHGLDEALEATRFFDAGHVAHRAPNGTWALAAISARDPTAPERLVVDGDTMIVFNGPALHGQGDQANIGQSILEAFGEGGSRSVAALLGGTYNFVGASQTEGMHAFVDFSGLIPLYYCQGSGFAVVSNRSTTVSRIVGAEGWDARALAWLIARPNLCGEEMPSTRARYLPPGAEATVDLRDGNLTLHHSGAWVWPSPSRDDGRDELTDDEWDEITESLVGNFRSLAAFAAHMRLNLTGGKDSRLCLALAKAAGLQGELHTQTHGSTDSPELEVAAEVARVAGFEHRRVGLDLSVPDPSSGEGQPSPSVDPARMWRFLRAHVYRHEAIVCPWDGTGPAMSGTMVHIKGFGGELYRGPGGFARRFSRLPPQRQTAERLHQLLSRLHNQPVDPLGVLTPPVRQYQDDWLRDWIARWSEIVPLELLGEKFFVDYRLGHWNGPTGQNRVGSITVNPLISPVAWRKMVELSAMSRDTEHLHFEVMRRAAPELVTIPFLGDTWSPHLAERSGLDLPTEPYPTASRPASIAWKKPVKWLFLGAAAGEIEQLFRDAAETSLSEICDVGRLVAWAQDAQNIEVNTEAKSLYSAIAVSLALLGRVDQTVDQPAVDPAVRSTPTRSLRPSP